MSTPNPKALVAATFALVAVTLSACGGDDGSNESADSTQSTKTIEIEMRDVSFSPNRITVRAEQKTRLVFRNVGKVAHDAFIGDEQAQENHEMEMRQTATTAMSGMDEHGTSKEGGITVEPGKSGEITHTFRSGDNVMIGCHEPGHYAAGMKIAVEVS